ncbi:MAG TPA: DNA topoisomerase IV, partial [Pseudoclavibacter sp.]|nr:DNA topoisomerase IV [Pseudoclavibacter sp.]
HFPSQLVRPQGRAAGGMTGLSLRDDDTVIFFSSIDTPEHASVVTVAAAAGTLPGAEPGTAKVSAFSEFPAKGRATGGVRAQRLLAGEDHLACAWVGSGIPAAVDARGRAIALPNTPAKRDASGTPVAGIIAGIGEIGSVPA